MAFDREKAKEYLERFYRDRYKQPIERDTANTPKCMCPFNVLLAAGCMCGGS